MIIVCILHDYHVFFCMIIVCILYDYYVYFVCLCFFVQLLGRRRGEIEVEVSFVSYDLI